MRPIALALFPALVSFAALAAQGNMPHGAWRVEALGVSPIEPGAGGALTLFSEDGRPALRALRL
jgi:hypothetical protein